MFLKRSAKPRSTSEACLESSEDYKHPVIVGEQRSEAIRRLLGEDELAVENESELGYDPNDSAIRRLRY